MKTQLIKWCHFKKTPLKIGKQWVAGKFENTLLFDSNSISIEKKTREDRSALSSVSCNSKKYFFKYMIQIFLLTKFHRTKKYIKENICKQKYIFVKNC